MKKYIVLLLTLFLMLALVLTGCTKTESIYSTDTNIIENQNKTEQREDLNPFEQDKGMSNGGVKTLTFDENNDLFTDRDLDQNPDLKDAQTIVTKDNSEYVISSAGIYVLSGQANNFTVKVDAGDDDKVQIVLNTVTVVNDNFPVIYVKSADKCFVTSLGNNEFSVNDQFVADGEINTDAVIFSKDDLTLNGTGSLTIISAAGNGITSKDDMKITGGKYNITAAKDGIEANDSISIYDGEFVIDSNKDGFHVENDNQSGSIYVKNGTFTITAKDDGMQATTTMVINDGTFNITAVEGLEATYVQINGGEININASDDGINATRKSNECDVVIEINGGNIVIVMGPGDTDGIDANGTIIVNGGTIDITGNSTFDADQGAIYNGGTIIINGVETNSIPISMIGGHGGNMDGRPQGNGGGHVKGPWNHQF